MEQGIEHKFLNPPLGEDEETKKQKQREAAAAALNEFNEMMKTTETKNKHKKEKKKKKEAIGANQADDLKKEKDEGEETKDNSTSSFEEPAKQKTRLERWRESLLACTNLSQVFVHLNTLDQSVTWSKSVLNARCRLCRRKGDAEHMLLCDACDRGHHMYCLKPPIKEVRDHPALRTRVTRAVHVPLHAILCVTFKRALGIGVVKYLREVEGSSPSLSRTNTKGL